MPPPAVNVRPVLLPPFVEFAPINQGDALVRVAADAAVAPTVKTLPTVPVAVN